MRSLLLLVLLVAAAPGCRCTMPGAGPLAGSSYEACRGDYDPGHRRPCYPAYRPIGSASSR
jgi:hypothetical protein